MCDSISFLSVGVRVSCFLGEAMGTHPGKPAGVKSMSRETGEIRVLVGLLFCYRWDLAGSLHLSRVPYLKSGSMS